jgi:hypothetical protein
MRIRIGVRSKSKNVCRVLEKREAKGDTEKTF